VIAAWEGDIDRARALKILDDPTSAEAADDGLLSGQISASGTA
jgi:hypothetical protein